MNMKHVEMHDGTTAIVNTSQVLWLEAGDPRMRRIHISGSAPISVKGSIADAPRSFRLGSSVRPLQFSGPACPPALAASAARAALPAGESGASRAAFS